VTAAEHFAWARTRALEYLDLGDPVGAMGSLVSDLGKCEGTAGILHPDLRGLMYQEYMLTGRPSDVRRFIETLAGPA
jgi:hypothetical protein